MNEDTLKPGLILTGPLFNEPMRVETIRPSGAAWIAGLVGLQTERFRNVTLTAEDLGKLQVSDATDWFDGDGNLLRRSPPAGCTSMPCPARFPWHEVVKVAHYYLSVDEMTRNS